MDGDKHILSWYEFATGYTASRRAGWPLSACRMARPRGRSRLARPREPPRPPHPSVRPASDAPEITHHSGPASSTPSNPASTSGPLPTELVLGQTFGLFYDPRLEQVVLVNGATENGPARAMELWRWTGAAWVLIDAAGPPARSFASFGRDPERGVVVHEGRRLPLDGLTDAGVRFEHDLPEPLDHRLHRVVVGREPGIDLRRRCHLHLQSLAAIDARWSPGRPVARRGRRYSVSPSTGASGRANPNSAPPPSRALAHMRPPSAVTMRSQTGSPRPSPLAVRCASELR